MRDLWDNIRYTNIYITKVLKEEREREREREKEAENLSEETMAENFPNLVKEIDI